MRNRVFSGIRATGRLHLGNYLGAVKGMLVLQETHDCVFSVVDLHTITTPYDPSALQSSIREIVLDYLAAGLDPKKCHLEIQSKVPQHLELAYLLSTIYPVSRLEDLPTYKEKKAQFPKYVNMGLLYYPVLQAADILLYKAELVPVGVDQEPHLEVTREIARKFNSMFSRTFPECQRYETEGGNVPSLLGKGKMSKTVEGSYILLTDDLETIKKRLARVPTDSGTVGGDPTLPSFRGTGIVTLLELFKLFKKGDLYAKYVQDYQNKKIRYSEMKNELAQVIFKELEPIQKRRKEFVENPELVDSIIKDGIDQCRQMAEETMKEVREKMGL
ncbi:MAG: tryptophan--tRNA ligase [Candidatus Levyibacteriota bacterium]